MTNPTHAEQWQPPEDVKPWMVSAACRAPSGYIVSGPRHWDTFMCAVVKPYLRLNERDEGMLDWDQGFIDQWGRFYTRAEALQAVKASGQPFNAKRNGGPGDDLYSEGLY